MTFETCSNDSPGRGRLVVHERRRDALGGALAFDVRRSRRSPRLEPDDGRRHRRGRRPHDPDRRALARRLRVVQLPRLRPRPGDHRRGRPALRAWGTHPSWSRLLGSPALYEQIESRLTELLGCEDSLALPTITHIHSSVIPVLAGSGTIFLDARAHKTIYDGCEIARAHGATVTRFRGDDPDDLELLLRQDRSSVRIVCMDGVNSMTRQRSEAARVRCASCAPTTRCSTSTTRTGSASSASAAVTRRARTDARGNSVIRHFDESYDNVVLVGGFSKAYSSLLAFIACPTELKNLLKVAAPPYLYSGPSPVASLATVLAGFDVNERRGDELRSDIYRMTAVALDALAALGVATPNRSGLPIIEVPLARPRADRRRRPLPLRAWDLRHARRVSAGAEERGRVPHPGHRRQHRRAAGEARGCADRARPALRAAAGHRRARDLRVEPPEGRVTRC